ncbi:MAG: hypothetical protein HUU16_21400 [Candidatus Omnitrophica bacterium]|nr:hypothetical protein [Candidatus Omnitrophota bacterium]
MSRARRKGVTGGSARPYPGDARGLDPARLLSSPLGVTLLGAEMTMEFYSSNGFRIISLPISATDKEVEKGIQRFRATFKLDPSTAIEEALKTGYEHLVTEEICSEAVSRLKDPRRRFLQEAFWPHLPARLFEVIRASGRIFSSEAVEGIKKEGREGQPLDTSLARHALAVLYHCEALRLEFDYLEHGGDWPESTWRTALGLWSQVCSDDLFWDYMRDRVAARAHFQLTHEDVESARLALPEVILRTNSLLARAYSEALKPETSRSHLLLIHGAGFLQPTVERVLIESVKQFVHARQEPLIGKLHAEILECQGSLDRKRFSALADPLLQEAWSIVNSLVAEMRLGEALVKSTEFDPLCAGMLAAINKKIDYGAEVERGVLFSLVLIEKLLQLPHSSAMKRDLEEAYQSKVEMIYRDFSLPLDARPTRCWFLGGEIADPDESLLIPVYKITRWEGMDIQWQSRKVLVPRSRLAAQFHRGKASKADLAKRVSAPQVADLKVQLDALRARCEETVRGHEQHLVVEQARIRDSEAQELSAIQHEMKDRETQARKELENATTAHQLAVKAAEGAYYTELSMLEKKYAGALASHQRDYEEFLQGNVGFRGFCAFELPRISLTVPSLAVSAVSLPWVDPSITTPLALSIGACAGLLMGWLTGRTDRIVRIRIGAIRREELERAIIEEKDRLKGHLDDQLAVRNAEFERLTTGPRGILIGAQKRREEVHRRFQSQIDNESKKTADQIHRLRSDCDREAAPLEKKIAAYVQVKPETERTSFIAYKGARSNGFKDGDGPPQAEIQARFERELRSIVESLSNNARQLLASLQTTLSQEEFIGFLVALSKMSSAERELAIVMKALGR